MIDFCIKISLEISMGSVTILLFLSKILSSVELLLF